MPTPSPTLATVAAFLGGFDRADDAAVTQFYRSTFPAFPEPARALIADLLMASTEPPSTEVLAELAAAIADLTRLPAPAAPDWPGPAMTYHPQAATEYAEAPAATAAAG